MLTKEEKRALRYQRSLLMSRDGWDQDEERLAEVRQITALLTGERKFKSKKRTGTESGVSEEELAVAFEKEYVENGLQVQAIAKKYHVSPAKVLRLLDSRDVKRKSNQTASISAEYYVFTDGVIKEIVSGYVKGVTKKELRKKYNLSVRKLDALLEENHAYRERERRINAYEERICQDYLNGISIDKLREKYWHVVGVNPYGVLKKRGVMRKRVGRYTEK